MCRENDADCSANCPVVEELQAELDYRVDLEKRICARLRVEDLEEAIRTKDISERQTTACRDQKRRILK